MKKKQRPRCHNCIFGGDQFKVGKVTHLHCYGPHYVKKDLDEGNISPWDTLREFWNTCNNHVYKPHPGDETPVLVFPSPSHVARYLGTEIHLVYYTIDNRIRFKGEDVGFYKWNGQSNEYHIFYQTILNDEKDK